jgi:hypothetical protein
LGIVLLPCENCFFIDPDSVLLDPAFKALQPLVRIVRTYPGQIIVIPVVQTADQVLANNIAVRKQCTPVLATSIEN